MKNAFFFVLIAIAACSASPETSAPNEEPLPSTNAGGSPQAMGPSPDETPVLDTALGLGDDLEVPDFPNVTGSGFGDGSFPSASCETGCVDFPSAPIVVAGGGAAITEADRLPFADPDAFTPGGLCVTEPQLSAGDTPGAMLPANWLRPRFRWAGGEAEALYELRLSNEVETSDLVVYTRQSEWIMPEEIWRDVARNVHTPITVSLRALDGGTVTGIRGTFEIAPVNAGGSLVFWATTTALVRRAPELRSRLFGFTVGDEAVIATLDPTQIELNGLMGEDGVEPRGTFAEESAEVTGYANGEVNCVGCHISTPDGASVVFTDNWPWNKLIASIDPEAVGQKPAFLSDAAQLMLSQPWLGTQTMSPGVFSNGTGRVLLTSYGVSLAGEAARLPWQTAQPQRHQLAWFDLTNTAPVATWTEAMALSNNPGNPDPNLNDNDNDDLVYPQTIAQLTPSPAQLAVGGRPQRIGVAPQELSRGELHLFRQATVANAEGTGWGLLSTANEPDSAVTPDWSHDGTRIAYVSTDVTSADGHPDWTANEADIKLVPYAARSGGESIPLAGASDPNFLEYYPAFSSDDQLLAFTRAPVPSNLNRTGCTPITVNGQLQPDPTCANQAGLGENPDGPYYNRNGEIYVVPSEGGTPLRLAANDPVACTGNTSRGSINSWPKWSPRAAELDGLTYYFLVFSSARPYEGGFELPRANYTPPVLTNSSQLYMAAIVVDANGNATSYPAVYLWNQNTELTSGGTQPIQGSNLTPAWDEFLLPPIVIQ